MVGQVCLVDCFCTGRPVELLGSPPQVWKKHLSCDRPYPYFVIDRTSRSFDSDSSSNPLFTRLLLILSRVWIALEHLLPFSRGLPLGPVSWTYLAHASPLLLR